MLLSSSQGIGKMSIDPWRPRSFATLSGSKVTLVAGVIGTSVELLFLVAIYVGSLTSFFGCRGIFGASGSIDHLNIFKLSRDNVDTMSSSDVPDPKPSICKPAG